MRGQKWKRIVYIDLSFKKQLDMSLSSSHFNIQKFCLPIPHNQFNFQDGKTPCTRKIKKTTIVAKKVPSC